MNYFQKPTINSHLAHTQPATNTIIIGRTVVVWVSKSSSSPAQRKPASVEVEKTHFGHNFYEPEKEKNIYY